MEGYGKRILIVDDDEHIRVLLCLLLEQDGYSVHAATGGEEALDEMMKRRFDIVLTDFDMPKRNGLDVLSSGRVICPDVPIIIMSALTREFKDVAKEQGAYACIEKPFDSQYLLNLLHVAGQTSRTVRSGADFEQGR